MIGPPAHTPFFTPDSELAELESHVRRLQSSAHAPPIDRAQQVLTGIQQAMHEKHKAQLQVDIATSARTFPFPRA